MFAEGSLAQNNLTPINETFPEYPGGESALIGFISTKLYENMYEKSKKIEGFVKLKFNVNDEGNTSSPTVVKSSGNGILDNDFLIMIEKMPAWKAGTTNGIPVSKEVELPIKFNVVKTGSVTSSVISLVENKENLIYSPTFKGGSEELFKFIETNKTYPKALKKEGIIGESIVKFLIDSFGKVCIPTIRQSSGNTELDKEAVRIITSMPNWTPAFSNSRRINQYCDLKVSFGKKSQLHELRKKNYELANENFNDGMKTFQENKLTIAKEKYKTAYYLNCYHSDALYNLGVTYFRLNQKDSACYYWNELKANFARKEADELIKKYCSN